ncbi:ATP-binding protein [Streptomyces sp. ISL-94]|uniref:ATP-binding protein n=1 Tax=Streptomyces sp. ISL-94 TaxID=2819190 RepID=UPI001BEA8643|nr:ATP-binding protein [Streptomyces sp. ISL-94]MBT2477514.1 ATP-binding protein [Streptomyces sp. ISL-94]
MTDHQLTAAAKPPLTPVRQLTLRFSSTRRGARLARRLAVQPFTEWTGLPYDSDPARAVALVTAELASNAIRHGRLPGRDFRLTLLLLPDRFRVEVTDTRPERLPPLVMTPPGDETSGRGLLLVQAYADHCGYTVRDAYTKTVWAEILTHGHAPPNTDHQTHGT